MTTKMTKQHQPGPDDCLYPILHYYHQMMMMMMTRRESRHFVLLLRCLMKTRNCCLQILMIDYHAVDAGGAGGRAVECRSIHNIAYEERDCDAEIF